MAKTKAKTRAPTFSRELVTGFNPLVVADIDGKLWRVDPQAGTMQPVTIEKPTPRRANAKPRPKRR